MASHFSQFESLQSIPSQFQQFPLASVDKPRGEWGIGVLEWCSIESGLPGLKSQYSTTPIPASVWKRI